MAVRNQAGFVLIIVAMSNLTEFTYLKQNEIRLGRVDGKFTFARLKKVYLCSGH